MTTVNISITEEQAKLVNDLTLHYGFSNRSEFFRAILRKIQQDPQIVDQANTFPFTSPVTKDSKKIMADFTKSGLYSKEMLADIKEGLENSNSFE